MAAGGTTRPRPCSALIGDPVPDLRSQRGPAMGVDVYSRRFRTRTDGDPFDFRRAADLV